MSKCGYAYRSSRNHNCSGRGFVWHPGPCHLQQETASVKSRSPIQVEFPRSKGMIILSSVPMTSPKFNAIMIMRGCRMTRCRYLLTSKWRTPWIIWQKRISHQHMPVRSAYVVGGAVGRSAQPTSARSCAAAVTVGCPICPQKDVRKSGRVSDGEPGDLQILDDRGPTYRFEFMPD